MQTFGRFTLLKKIGQGGMAEIFLAEAPTRSGRSEICVIKRMLPQLQKQKEVVDMFLTEADICTFLRHENLIDVYEADEIDGCYYMAMEYAQGLELERFLQILVRHGRACPPGLVVTVGMRMAKALDYLHRATTLGGTPLNLIHRDVNPTNIFLLDSGGCKLGDLGVARVSFVEGESKQVAIKGKLRYLAPELLLRKPADQRVDTYDLGVTLWEMCTGTRAFQNLNDLQTMREIVEHGLTPVRKLRKDIPKALAAIIDRAIALHADDRFASAADLYRALRGVAEGGTVFSNQQMAQAITGVRDVG